MIFSLQDKKAQSCRLLRVCANPCLHLYLLNYDRINKHSVTRYFKLWNIIRLYKNIYIYAWSDAWPIIRYFYLSQNYVKRTAVNMCSYSLIGKRIDVFFITFNNLACMLKNKRHSKRCCVAGQTLLLKEQWFLTAKNNQNSSDCSLSASNVDNFLLNVSIVFCFDELFWERNLFFQVYFRFPPEW